MNVIILLSLIALSKSETALNNILGSSDKPTTTTQKMKLTIAILLPQDYIRLRNFNVCINKEMNRINKGSWSFTKHFYLDRFG